MKMTKQEFGQVSGADIDLFVLENTAGMQVKIMTYGATITSISIPGENDKRVELACGFDSLEGYFSDAYKANAPYFGCTVGRFASRIKDGKFTLEGKEYSLATNNDPNHLHGGIVGFDKKVWQAKEVGPNSVEMSLESADMEEGYPGNVKVSVQFTLTEDNKIEIDYKGETDKATPLSLTNHTYFNLSGFAETIENHLAKIVSDTLLVPDETGVPVGEEAAVTEVDDLRTSKKLGDLFKEMETGYEHFYALPADGEVKTVAEFDHPTSGRKLEVLSNEPGLLFYTGYFTSDELKRENGDQFGKYKAFCCETSRYANGPNIAGSPGSITTPNKPYSSKTVYAISW
ncbi:aldose epimerase family protein [Flammeovirgaceae bacterium SG7u.111]|nr:aldose epimerase family protein [Flammeovirgaceae bacterium SG7u.132]WPO33657.1 aldose epimerase family protein [Flammeovirgaceae bacterium SG7u.111]